MPSPIPRPIDADLPARPAPARGLRGKIGVGFILQAAAITCGAILGVYAAAAIMEDILIRTALREEAQHYLEILARDPGHPEPDTHNMRGYLLRPGSDPAVVPEPLRHLGPGYHTLQRDVGRPLIYVTDTPHGRLYLRFDQEHVGQLALFFGLLPLTLVLLFVYLTSFAAYRLSRRAISPVIWLANEVRRWDPNEPKPDALAPERIPEDLDGETRQLGDSLYGFARRITEFIERERTFTRDASHELRSPLTVIKIAAEVILAEDGLDPYVERNVRRIASAAKDMEALIEAFLLLARDAETGGLPAEWCSVNRVVREEVERAEPLLEGKDVRIELREECELRLYAPPKVLGIVVGNLVRNACAYTERGTVRVQIDAQAVTIEDTGRGMSAEDLERAFQPFFRSKSSPGGGVGVGLTIVRRLSDRYAWPVSLDSAPGRGTKAVIRLPNAERVR